jgi:FHS family L-fucose permease-like MFS transporter
MKHKKLALSLIFCLFFLWAISSNLLPTMIRQLMKTCELNTFEASFTESAYWLAYFICPIPIAMFMRRYSYRVGIITGLLIAALGGLLFFPAAMVKSYSVYLCIFFVIATGMCFLETAANPYVTVLGDPQTAPRRLNLAQSFNGLGAFISAMFLSKLVLSGNDFTRETLPADYVGGWEAYIQTETDSMKLPYLLLASALILVALILVWVKLPKVGEEESNVRDKKADVREKLIDFSAMKRAHLCWGVIAQFFYNGGQTAINSLFLVYSTKYAGINENTATTFFGLYMLAFLVGRWVGTLLMGRFKPEHMLTVYALMNVVLCGIIMTFGGYVGLYAMLAVSFFMSIIYPTQFSLALDGLGGQTKSGSAFLVMAIVGNACVPQFTAFIMDRNKDVYQIAYIIPLVCFVICAFYGIMYRKFRNGYYGKTKRYVQFLDITKDPELIEQYRYWHSKEHHWKEVREGIRAVGILEMELYMQDNRVAMVVDAPTDFNWQEAMDKLATLPRQTEWEAFVARFQGCSSDARSDEKWQQAERIFRLY